MVNWPTIGVIAAVLTLFIGIMQWIISRANKKGESNQKINDAHERMKAYDSKSTECEKRFVQLEERKTDNRSFDDLRIDVKSVQADVRSIRFDMESIKMGVGRADQLTQSFSPIGLTDKGRVVATDAGIYDGIEANWGNIIALLDNTITSSNPYDIQQACFNLAIGNLEDILLPESMEKLKMYAFSTGNSVLYYGRVVGIVIRDKYFESKGMDIFEIDKHDPTKKTE